MGGHCNTITTEDFHTSAARLYCFGSGNQKTFQQTHHIRATEKVIPCTGGVWRSARVWRHSSPAVPPQRAGNFSWSMACRIECDGGARRHDDATLNGLFSSILFIFTIYDLPTLQSARCRAHEFGGLSCLTLPTLSTHTIYHYCLQFQACLWTASGETRPLVDTLLPYYFSCFTVLRVGGRQGLRQHVCLCT